MNPYVSGRQVPSSMFFGREAEFSRLEALLIDSVTPQHVQVVGEIRSGKSTLVGEFLRRHSSLPFIVVALDLSVHFRGGLAPDFFNQLLQYIVRDVSNSAKCNDAVLDASRQLQSTNGFPSIYALGNFFQELGRAGMRVLVVLDEFDYSLELFKLDEQAFKYLRHIASNFEAVTLLTVSRRSIFEIEYDGGLSSNLAGVMPEHIYVSQLSRDAAERLVREPALRQGIVWEDSVIDRLIKLSGCHACLLQRLAWHLFDKCRAASAESRIATLEQVAPRVFSTLFDDMERRLRRFGLWNVLVSFVVTGEVEREDRDRLERLGYLLIEANGDLVAFSPLLDEAVRGRDRRPSPGAGSIDNMEIAPLGSLAGIKGSSASPEKNTGSPVYFSRESPKVSDRSAFDIAIVCALRNPELKRVLDTGVEQWRELDPSLHDPATYHVGAYKTLKGTTLKIVAAAPSQMGMPATAVLTTKMVRRFTPKLVAVLGIAAGVKGSGRGFGDILTPDCTFDYGAGKFNTGDNKLHFSPDPNPISISPVLRNRLKDWELKNKNLASIRDGWGSEPAPTVLRLHVGSLGSGAAVVADPQIVDNIRDHWRKLIGIEMEAYGAHLACQEAQVPPPMFLCMKSICDFADSDKKDDWQHYAAYTSARLCEEFLSEEWERLFPQ